MKKLYAHQQRFLDKNPDRGLLLWEVGTGKSFAACEWLKLRPDRKALVVCPKAIVKKWRKDLADSGVEADVVTRDEIKVTDTKAYNALVVDEAHDFAAPLFTAQRSQRASKLYYHIKNHPDTHILLLSATPIRSTPYNLQTIACYLGRYWPINAFRNEYFDFVDRYGRFHYEPKKNWRLKVREPLETLADIVLMSDCVDVPVQEHEVIHVKEEKYEPDEYLEPSAEWHDHHRFEQGENKWKVLKAILDGYRKVIVVAYYREQIDDYVRRIGDERQVYIIHGGISDQETVVQQAQQSDDCIFIIQASLGSGFDADTFSVMVFASMAYSYVSYVQMQGRIRRIHNLHANKYIYLLAGECDEAVYKTIQAGKDFDPIAYLTIHTAHS